MICIQEHRRHPLPSFLPSFQTELDTTLLPLKMSNKSFSRDVDRVADTGPVDWDVNSSDHSQKKGQAVENGRAIKSFAGRELQADHSENLRQ